jgi:hypothetical protein
MHPVTRQQGASRQEVLGSPVMKVIVKGISKIKALKMYTLLSHNPVSGCGTI